MKIIDRRLFTTADPQTGRPTRTLVEDGDPRAAFLWASAGAEKLEDECKAFGYEPNETKAKATVARATAIDETPPDLSAGVGLVAPMTDEEREAEMDTKSGPKPADKAQGKPADKRVGRPSDKGR